MKYAFCVESRKNAKVPFVRVYVRNFDGGYVGQMLWDAKDTAKQMRGKLRKSVNGYDVEAAESHVKRGVAEMFNASVYNVIEEI